MTPTLFIRRFAPVTVTVILLSMSAAINAESALVHLKEAHVLTVTLSPIFIAIENGYFKDEGLAIDFTPVDSGRLSTSALVAGQVQITDMGLTDLVDLQSQGKDPIIVYNLANNLTMNLVVGSATMRRIGVTRASPLADREQALKGLTFGISAPGALSELYVRYLIKQGGLDPDKDVTFVSVGGGIALLSALEYGEIDAYLQSPPTPFIAEERGSGTILISNTAGDVPEFTNFPFNAIAVSKTWAEANPQAMEGYSRALDKAYAFMVEHPDDAIQIVHDHYFPETPLETVKISFMALLPIFKPDGRFAESGIKNEATVLLSLGSIDAMPDTAEGVLWSNQWNPDTLPNLPLPTESATAAPTAEVAATGA